MPTGSLSFVIDASDSAAFVDNPYKFAVHRSSATAGNELLFVHDDRRIEVFGPIGVAGAPLVVQGRDADQPVARFNANGETRFDVTQEGVGRFPQGLVLPQQRWALSGDSSPGVHVGELNIVIIDPSYWAGRNEEVDAWWTEESHTFLAVWDGTRWRLFYAG